MAQGFATGLQPSETLQGLLAALSSKQAAAVIRIVEAELAGVSIEMLFAGPNKICARSTYYRDRGWAHKPEFQKALAQARIEVRGQSLKGFVDSAIEELKQAAPLAARDLRRQVEGDEPAVQALRALLLNDQMPALDRVKAAFSLGHIGTRAATDALVEALAKPKEENSNAETVEVEEDVFIGVRPAVIEALGYSAPGVNVQRRMADIAILDRADEGTADKGSDTDEQIVVYIPDNERADRNPAAARAADAVPGQPS